MVASSRCNISYWLIAICFLCTKASFAQFMPDTDIPVYQYGSILDNPMTGGFSSAQFSDIDINSDGMMDIFAFDRGAWTTSIFIRQADQSLKYEPGYSKQFPAMQYWALLRDYNGDGIQDIFTYNGGSTAVYTGKIVDGSYTFEFFKSELIYTDGPATVALYTSSADIPSIDDIDGDGDLDILSFSVSNATIRFYHNISIESGFDLDSLNFTLDDLCWGELFEEATCDGATMFVACKGGDDAAIAGITNLHIGSTISTFDRDGDGDKDALIGDNLCNNMVYFRNGGASDYAQMVYRDSEFPHTTLSFNMPVFPSSFFVDADNDGDKDVLLSTNEHLIGQNIQQVWLYENQNTNDTFDLVFATDTFLVSETIDAGLYSKAIFFDYNADGLQDILVGVGSTLGNDDIVKHGMWLYENTGSLTNPAFTLITTDYAGLGDLPSSSQFAPAPGDPDNDGDIDLAVGINDGTICYLENTAGPGNVAAYATPVCVWNGIAVGQLASPCFIDIDLDNKLDLVVGELNGNLNYFRNTGTLTSPVYTLQSDIWGGVDVREPLTVTGYSSPFMYRNENDSLYLLVGSQSGKVHGYNEIEEALMGEFYEFNENYLGYYHGTYASIWGADITGDGKMEWLSGNFRGGFQIFTPDNGTSITDAKPAPPVYIAPVPADNYIDVSWNLPESEDVVVECITLTGAIVFSATTNASTIRLDIADNWAPGMYLIRIRTANTNSIGKCIIR